MCKKSGYRVVIEDCLEVKKDETVLILTDDNKTSIGKSLYEEAKIFAKEAVLMVMEPRKVSGEEPPEAVAEAMKAFDVILCPTSTSITHTNAKMNAVDAGARLASMPGITEEMFHEGAITADYKKVEELTLRLTEILSHAKTAKVIKGSYSLEMSLAGRKGIASTGIYKNPGESGNLPSGEAYIAPVEGSAHGEMLVDGSMVGVGILEIPLYMKIVDGRLVEVRGKDREKIEVLFDNERNGTLGELGIGTNHAARLTGVILEDEKIYGTVHIAFGTNTSFGGVNKADCHLDGVIINPTLYLDDLLVLKDGKMMI
ncbi:aminopeptidase [Geosporobacter ferrireducens]|uniref:aminopeptidase n=1 Tax=Geosporobacter ferrireducens TaxID=1424294 RepID=UPI000A4AADAE|nr:aminopeptidase [Geosporobacter ferrireducens]